MPARLNLTSSFALWTAVALLLGVLMAVGVGLLVEAGWSLASIFALAGVVLLLASAGMLASALLSARPRQHAPPTYVCLSHRKTLPNGAVITWDMRGDDRCYYWQSHGEVGGPFLVDPVFEEDRATDVQISIHGHPSDMQRHEPRLQCEIWSNVVAGLAELHPLWQSIRIVPKPTDAVLLGACLRTAGIPQGFEVITDAVAQRVICRRLPNPIPWRS